ncbi:hypothetical protein MtrunA17_Chr5g0415651 [Medicago truncatula]|uniref:Uncharacterized protein n=1 Tax=Medicago truncatula TaxID=3880 RepID=A0A396HPI6_MEDTR|nr:hypothetical protein MtrunA17_Chr5g0415651 [Medicago truncatula]
MQIEREKNMTKFLKLVYASIFLLYLILGLRDGASQTHECISSRVMRCTENGCRCEGHGCIPPGVLKCTQDGCRCEAYECIPPEVLKCTRDGCHCG